jgi:signal transduction histidine kinase/DNA-binding NarL/FixJ family response regulator
VSELANRPLVWIADDSDTTARHTQSALGDQYNYERFADGAAVVERIAAGARLPDALLLDWVMPAMTGGDVCKFLRSRPETVDLPIIIVTASRVETADVVQGLSIGANDYVPRPFVPEELRARVDTAIRGKRLRDARLREKVRLSAIASLGHAFIDIGPNPERVLEALAKTLTEGLCDGSSVVVMPNFRIVAHRDKRYEHLIEPFGLTDPCDLAFASDAEAKAALPPAYHPAIDQVGISALAVVAFPERSSLNGVVTVMRNRSSAAFEREDLDTLRTCAEYTAMAFENAMRFDAERQARREFQAILEYVPVGIVVTDPAGSVTFINEKATEIAPQMRHARSVDQLGQLAPPLSRALSGERIPVESLALEAKHVRATAARVQGGGAILVFEDVSAEYAAAEERKRAAKFQEYVLGIVSHDLRTPLQTLVMGAEGIKRLASEQPKILAFAERMENTTNRMTGIINQLLDVVRTQSGSVVSIERQRLDLDKLVRGVVEEMSIAYPNAKLEAKLAPVAGHWDPDRLGQVVMNLIGNAIQHGMKAVPISIETERYGELAVFRVRNGSVNPLTTEQIATLFDAFKRGNSSSRSGGLGLGLYISKEIVRAHQGDISVVSDPVMTTFEVRLPLQRV